MRLMTDHEEYALQRFTAFIAGVAAKVNAPPFPGKGATRGDVDDWIVKVGECLAEPFRQLSILERERLLLAMLAAPAPEFTNPLQVMEALEIRDRILAEREARR